MKMIKYQFSMAYMGRKMYSNSLYYIKATNKYYDIPKQRKEVGIIANLPEIVSFMYQKANKMSAVSKLGYAMSRPCTVLCHLIAFCYSHLTVYLSPMNLSQA